MIKNAALHVTDYGPYWAKVPLDYSPTLYAAARYAIQSSNSQTVMWTNDPKVVEEYAIQFARNITSTEAP